MQEIVLEGLLQSDTILVFIDFLSQKVPDLVTSFSQIRSISHKDQLLEISSKDSSKLAKTTLMYFPFMNKKQMMNEKVRDACTVKVKLREAGEVSPELQKLPSTSPNNTYETASFKIKVEEILD